MRDLLVPLPLGEIIDRLEILRVKTRSLETQELRDLAKKQFIKFDQIARELVSSITDSIDVDKLEELQDKLFQNHNEAWDLRDLVEEAHFKKDYELFWERHRKLHNYNVDRVKLKNLISALLSKEDEELKNYIFN